MVSREEFEGLKEVVKELIDTNKKQLEAAQIQQKQIIMLNEAVKLLQTILK